MPLFPGDLAQHAELPHVLESTFLGENIVSTIDPTKTCGRPPPIKCLSPQTPHPPSLAPKLASSKVFEASESLRPHAAPASSGWYTIRRQRQSCCLAALVSVLAIMAGSRSQTPGNGMEEQRPGPRSCRYRVRP